MEENQDISVVDKSIEMRTNWDWLRDSDIWYLVGGVIGYLLCEGIDELIKALK